MQVTIKDTTGIEHDVTSIYLSALEGRINREEYIEKLNEISGK